MYKKSLNTNSKDRLICLSIKLASSKNESFTRITGVTEKFLNTFKYDSFDKKNLNKDFLTNQKVYFLKQTTNIFVNTQLSYFLKTYKITKLLNNYKNLNSLEQNASILNSKFNISNTYNKLDDLKVVTKAIKQPELYASQLVLGSANNKNRVGNLNFSKNIIEVSELYSNSGGQLTKATAKWALNDRKKLKNKIQNKNFLQKKFFYNKFFLYMFNKIYYKKQFLLSTKTPALNLGRWNPVEADVFRKVQHNNRTYRFMQTVLAKYLETTFKYTTDQTIVDNTTIVTTLKPSNNLTKNLFTNLNKKFWFSKETNFCYKPVNLLIQTRNNIVDLNYDNSNCYKLKSNYSLLFNNINNKSFLSYWLIPIAGLAFLTPLNSGQFYLWDAKTSPPTQTYNLFLRNQEEFFRFNTRDARPSKNKKVKKYKKFFSKNKSFLNNLYMYINTKTLFSKKTLANLLSNENCVKLNSFLDTDVISSKTSVYAHQSWFKNKSSTYNFHPLFINIKNNIRNNIFLEQYPSLNFFNSRINYLIHKLTLVHKNFIFVDTFNIMANNDLNFKSWQSQVLFSDVKNLKPQDNKKLLFLQKIKKVQRNFTQTSTLARPKIIHLISPFNSKTFLQNNLNYITTLNTLQILKQKIFKSQHTTRNFVGLLTQTTRNFVKLNFYYFCKNITYFVIRNLLKNSLITAQSPFYSNCKNIKYFVKIVKPLQSYKKVLNLIDLKLLTFSKNKIKQKENILNLNLFNINTFKPYKILFKQLNKTKNFENKNKSCLNKLKKTNKIFNNKNKFLTNTFFLNNSNFNYSYQIPDKSTYNTFLDNQFKNRPVKGTIQFDKFPLKLKLNLITITTKPAKNFDKISCGMQRHFYFCKKIKKIHKKILPNLTKQNFLKDASLLKNKYANFYFNYINQKLKNFVFLTNIVNTNNKKQKNQKGLLKHLCSEILSNTKLEQNLKSNLFLQKYLKKIITKQNLVSKNKQEKNNKLKINKNNKIKAQNLLKYNKQYNKKRTKQLLTTITIVFKHQKMFKNQNPELELFFKVPDVSRRLQAKSSGSLKAFNFLTKTISGRLYLQKKRKAKKQRLETRRQKKRTRFFPRPNWLRYRMFLTFLNQRNFKPSKKINNEEKKPFNFQYASAYYKKNCHSKTNILQINHQAILNGFLQSSGKNKTINNKLNKYNFKKLDKYNFINNNIIQNKFKKIKKPFLFFRRIIASEQTNKGLDVRSKDLIAEKIILKPSKTFFNKINPNKNKKISRMLDQNFLRDLKIKANYVNLALLDQKINNPAQIDKDKDKDTIFRDFWIWTYNHLVLNNYNQNIWWLLPKNKEKIILKSKKLKKFNKKIVSAQQVKNAFTLTRIHWALTKTNNSSFTDYNKRYILWGSQKLRNQSKNNKTKFLEKQFITNWETFFLNKKINGFYKKLTSKLKQKTQKLNYLTTYSKTNITTTNFISEQTNKKLKKLKSKKIKQSPLILSKNITMFNPSWWTNLNLKPFLNPSPNFFETKIFKSKNQEITSNYLNYANIKYKYQDYKSIDFKRSDTNWINTLYNKNSTLIISITALLHFCALLSLVSINQVRCFVKFHLILLSKLSNLYIALITKISDQAIIKLNFNKILTNRSLDKISCGMRQHTENLNFEIKIKFLQRHFYFCKNLQTKFQLFNKTKLLTYFSLNLLKKEFKTINNLKNKAGFDFLNKFLINPKNKIALNKVLQLQLEQSLHSPSQSLGKKIIIKQPFLFFRSVYSKMNLISLKSKFLKLESSTKVGAFPQANACAQNFYFCEQNQDYKIRYIKFSIRKNTSIIVRSSKNFVFKGVFNFIDLFQSFIRSISSFFEKPAEFTTNWIAFGFLVEWSSDLITIIPENVDIYVWNVFSKIIRITLFKNYSVLILNNLGILGVTTSLNTFITSVSSISNKNVFNSLLSYTNNAKTSHTLQNNFLALALFNHLLQRRIFYLFDSFVETISQPDADLMRRQQKGTLFWDIWADFLVTAADYYNVNVAALSTIKAEQNKIFKKIISNKTKPATEFLYTLKNFNTDSKLSSLMYPRKIKNKKYLEKFFVQENQTLTKDLIKLFPNINRWSVNQYITYQSWHSHNGSNNSNGDLFIDYHPPKSFLHIPTIKYNSILQQPIGTLVCQIYSGIFNKQISKNILLVNPKISATTEYKSKKKSEQGSSKNFTSQIATNYNILLIQALAGETELKIITDNAQRYALVNRGFAIGIKLLRDVFDAIALNTPCIFLLLDIHAIGERRPMLISDYGGANSDHNGSFKEDFFGSQRDEVHEKNQVVYQLTRHSITHYRKPFKGDYTLCLTPDHDVLTTEGWIPINKVTTDHTVATFDRNTGELLYQKPTKIYHYPNYKGTLYHVKNEQIDLLTTLNHRMLVKNGRISGNSLTGYNLIPAKDIIGKRMRYLKTANWTKKDYQFVLPSVTWYFNHTIQPKVVDMEAWLTFFGLWIAEGCVAKNSIHYEVIVTQKKINNIKIIKDAITKLGYKYHVSNFNIRIYNKQLYKYLEPLSVGASNKSLPSWVWELSQKQAQLLLYSMCLGDCTSRKTTMSYYSSSINLADDVMRLALHAGWSGNKQKENLPKGTKSYIDGRTIIAQYDNWRISIIKKRNHPTVNHGHHKKQQFQKEELIPYEGPVFCLSVPNETFYVRRNDLPVWTGNSIPTNLYVSDLFLKSPTKLTSNLSLVENHNFTIKPKIHYTKNQTQKLNYLTSEKNLEKIQNNQKISHLQLSKPDFNFAPPSTSPFTVLLLKEEKKLKPNKIVEELPWSGLPGEQLATKPRTSYSVRAKVSMLAELSLSNLSAKLDMITDLLVIIDSVRSNKGFVVFATTDVPHILDPALRRPGRLDETICMPNISNSGVLNFTTNYEIIKSIKPNINLTKNKIKNIKNPENLNFEIKIKFLLPQHTDKTLLTVNLKDYNTVLNIGYSTQNNFLNYALISHSNIVKRKHFQKQKNLTCHKLSLVLNKKIKNQNVKNIKPNYKNIKPNYKAIAYYEVGKILLNLALLDPNKKKKISQMLDQTNYNLNTVTSSTLKSINYLTLYGLKNNIFKQIMFLFGGKISQLLGSQELRKKAMSVCCRSIPHINMSINNNKNVSFNLYQNNLFNFDISQIFETNSKFQIATKIMLAFIHKRYLYKKNLIVPKLLSFIDGNVLDEPPSPPFSSLLIPAKRFENYKRVFHDSIFGNKIGQRKTQISFIEKIQYHLQFQSIQFLKNKFGRKNYLTSPFLFLKKGNYENLFKNIPTEKNLQTPTNINWYYQNRILKRHGQYLTNQWWNGQLSEHNAETVFLSDIDWRSSFIKNKQIRISINDATSVFTNSGLNKNENLHKNKNFVTSDELVASSKAFFLDAQSSKIKNLYTLSTTKKQRNFELDVLLDFPDTDQYYNPRRRRWLLNKGYWSFWFNFDKVYSDEIISTWILESVVLTYTYLHNNVELLDFITTKFIALGYINIDILSKNKTKTTYSSAVKEIISVSNFKRFLTY